MKNYYRLTILFALHIILLFSLAPANAVDCPIGDLYADCQINLKDVQVLGMQWLDASCSGPACADLDGTGGVNMKDYAILVNHMFEREFPVLINEFMAKNDSFVQDPYGNYDDWIEIYNYSDASVDISGMYLSDDLSATTKWQVPDTHPAQTTIPPFGFLIIWADDEILEGPLHTNFALRAGGEQIILSHPDGTMVDGVIFGPQNSNESYGRVTDGQGAWQIFSSPNDLPTPGQANGSPPVNIIFSEIMYHPSNENDLEEYIELYNAGTASVNLLGYKFINGIDFVLPDVTVGPGQYLVVASNQAAFSAKYPGVTNVVGGWTGKLSNKGEAVELVNTINIRIDRVKYADSGNWGKRQLGPLDNNHRGWEWADDHDGGGKSLELININMSNDNGQNWAASTTVQGTPGILNSIANNDIAPIILDVDHFPTVPDSNEPVTVTAEIIDELPSGYAVTLYYRQDVSTYSKAVYPQHDANDYNTVTMFDDGLHGDGIADDDIYGAQIPAHPNKAIIEFYIETIDSNSNTRTWPAPSTIDGSPEQVTNMLYQVDHDFDFDTNWTPGSQPIYYLIMTNAENIRLKDLGDGGGEQNSDAQMNATFISVDGVDIKTRYICGVRNRGQSTRTGPPNNYRVNFVHDRTWKSVSKITINYSYPYSQLIGNAVFRMAGLVTPDAASIQLRVNGDDLSESGSRMFGSYIHIETFGGDFIDNKFPDDNNGNLYKAQIWCQSCSPTQWIAGLYYEGADPAAYSAAGYYKNTNEEYDDWSDLINLTNILDNTPDPAYTPAVEAAVDVDQWMRWFAVHNLIGNNETNLGNGRGDDYRLYMGVNDPRAKLIVHDMDTVLGLGDTPNGTTDSIFRAADPVHLPVIERFLKHPDFVQRYYAVLKELVETTFAPENMHPLIDQVLGGLVPQSTVNAVKQFVVDRNANVLSQIPMELTAASALSVVDGFYRTTGSTAAVFGSANVIETRSVLVNDSLAVWAPADGQWSITGIALSPGINRLVVEAFDGDNGTGNLLDTEFIDIWYDDATSTNVAGGAISSNTVWDFASSPWRVTGNLTINAGVTLTIEPGTTVYFDNATSITINGRILAQGTKFLRIRLTKTPNAGVTSWNGLSFVNSLEDSRLSYIDMDYASGTGNSINIDYSQLLIDNMTWPNSTNRALELLHPSLIVRNSIFHGINGEVIHGEYIENSEYFIVENNIFLRGNTGGDIIDFMGADRPGPVFQIMNNTFYGGPDDGLDLDGTDAHIEGNIFMDFHYETSRSTTSNAIATGLPQSGAPNRTQITVARNVFLGSDHAILLKEDAFGTIINNVFVGSDIAAIQFHEVGGTSVGDPAKGAYLDGNIFLDNADLFQHQYSADPCVYALPTITVNNTIISEEKHNLGTGNIDTDPSFIGDNNDFHLRAGSAAIGTGPNLRDMGVYVPGGATVSGEPDDTTRQTGATLYADGPAINYYKYRLKDNGAWSGAWSGEIDVNVPIVLSSLLDGHTYQVYTLGKNKDDIWPGDPNGNPSYSWTIDTSYTSLVINEIIADANGGPDLIELYYNGPGTLDLTDMSITDDPALPRKYVFAATTTDSNGYAVLYADSSVAAGHLNFALDNDGEGVYLYDTSANSGTLIDSVVFGIQLPEMSIGRIGRNHEWTLNKPSFSNENIREPLGNKANLKINEWLANEQVLFSNDFIEIYNPDHQPVDMGGLFFTDDPIAKPNRHQITQLSFVAGQGYGVFIADDDTYAGAHHLNFKLSSEQELIVLSDDLYGEIDKVIYYSQTTDVSQGRSPDGAATLAFFELPTPGVANSNITITITTTNLMDIEDVWSYEQSGTDLGTTWRDVAYDSNSWPTGAALLYVEDSSLPAPKNTPLTLGQTTYYFRRHFTFSDDPNDVSQLELSTIIDDGAVVYLNGNEVLRIGMPTGTITHSTFSARTIYNSNYEYFEIPSADLLPGDNVIAIEVHQTNAGSSDIVLGAALDSVVTVIDNDTNSIDDDLAILDGLRITEMMYHPSADANLEYIELQNISDANLDITGVRFTKGIDFTFPSVILEPGEYIVIARDETLFEVAYPAVDAIGEYTGALDNGGEDIVLKLALPFKAAILRFEYDDAWYPPTDGGGSSLEIVDPFAYPATWDDAESWQPAAPNPGS